MLIVSVFEFEAYRDGVCVLRVVLFVEVYEEEGSAELDASDIFNPVGSSPPLIDILNALFEQVIVNLDSRFEYHNLFFYNTKIKKTPDCTIAVAQPG